MYTDCEGLVLRQTKTLNGRRMMVLFTKKYGKISAGTSISERGKNKSTLALRPFTFGRYELFKNKDMFSINGAETIKSYYQIGENVDKYMTASYALELTDKLVPEDQPSPLMFDLIDNFLGELENRKASFDTLLIAFMIKALKISGCAPNTNGCVLCGNTAARLFSVSDGGLLCDECGAGRSVDDGLIFEFSNDIIKAIQFMEASPLKSLENLALSPDKETLLLKFLRKYFAFHLGIENLKSEGLRI